MFKVGDRVRTVPRVIEGVVVVRPRGQLVVFEDSDDIWHTLAASDLEPVNPATAEVSVIIDNYGLGLSINGERASIHDFTDSQLESMRCLCDMEMQERYRTETTEDAE